MRCLGGLAAMLSRCIAIRWREHFSPLGSAYLVIGAVAGKLDTALGLVASVWRTNRLITAPCAPAGRRAFCARLATDPEKCAARNRASQLVVVALLCGGLQILFGVVRLGRLIKYMPFPVVSGYLSGVGLIIILSQTPKLLGVPADKHFMEAVSSPHLWKWQGITVGV